jgi:hypothetical protein
VETLESGCGGYIAASFSRAKVEEVVVVDFVVVAAANRDVTLAIDEGVVAEDVLVAFDAEEFVFTIALIKEVVFNKGSDVPAVAVVAVQANGLATVSFEVWAIVEVVVVDLDVLGGAVDIDVSAFAHSGAKIAVVYTAERGIVKVDPVNRVLCVVEGALGYAYVVGIGDQNADLVKVKT